MSLRERERESGTSSPWSRRELLIKRPNRAHFLLFLPQRSIVGVNRQPEGGGEGWKRAKVLTNTLLLKGERRSRRPIPKSEKSIAVLLSLSLIFSFSLTFSHFLSLSVPHPTPQPGYDHIKPEFINSRP